MHYRKNGNIVRDLFILFLGAVFFYFEFSVFLRIFNGENDAFPDLIIYHLFFALIVIFCGLVWSFVFRRDICNYMFFALFFVPLGFFGICGYYLFYIVFKVNTCIEKTTEEYYEEYFPKNTGVISRVHENILNGKSAASSIKDITAFRDILVCGSMTDRQRVLVSVISNYSPAFAPILMMAAKDTDSSIRTMALNAVSVIKNRYLQRSIILRKRMDENPGNMEIIREYAEFMDDYAYMGLLDKKRENEVISKAVAAYITIFRAEKNKIPVIYKIVRGYIRLLRYRDAYEWIKKYQSLENSSNSALEDWNIECLYELRFFDELKVKATARLNEIVNSAECDRYPKNYIQALALWKGAKDNG